MRSIPDAYVANGHVHATFDGLTIPVAAERRGAGRLMVFPLPRIVRDAERNTHMITLDLSRWYLHDAIAGTLPVECPSQFAAQDTADAWLSNVAVSVVDPADAVQVAGWCTWWAAAYPERATAVEVPGERRAAAAPIAWPATEPVEESEPALPAGVVEAPNLVQIARNTRCS